jgi:hypothetical protein
VHSNNSISKGSLLGSVSLRKGFFSKKGKEKPSMLEKEEELKREAENIKVGCNMCFVSCDVYYKVHCDVNYMLISWDAMS